MDYNLLDEPWIPVLYGNGEWRHVGLLEALRDSARIRQIAANNPMDRVAILRFLLAILYWSRGNPPENASETSGPIFTEEAFAKLETHRNCFNLLGEGKRFYQDRGASRMRPTTDLIQEIPTGNNFWHFKHSTDGQNGLCPVCCVIGLLRLPLFSVSGLPDLKAGINGTPPIYVVRCGDSLQETLYFNWVTCEKIGQPSWDKSCPLQDRDPGVPILQGLTLLSRRVFLHPPSNDAVGGCISCGSVKGPLIRTCEFQSAGPQENPDWTDPHVLYSTETPRKSSKAPDLTAGKKFRMDRPWFDLLTRMIEMGKLSSQNQSLRFLLVGFATDKAKNIDVWERTLVLPVEFSPSEVFSIQIEQWKKGNWYLEKSLGRSKTNGPAAISTIRPHVENQVSDRLSDLLGGGEEAWRLAAEEYRPLMKSLARSLSPGFTTEAVALRRKIARTVPDMTPKAETPEKKLRISKKEKKG
ncbi:MAG TPA: type I-E CRISPR-associated protein Cse1/CasA [Candidatus Sumerlaeota bacterium]|nr:type I-E CRISPR-associated protein Cse1/CasA [Candidatus Sumerlaeota bacterium]